VVLVRCIAICRQQRSVFTLINFLFDRRCHSQKFFTPGVYHYTCVSLTQRDRNAEYAPDDVWSTVLVDTAGTDTIVKNVDPEFYRQDNIHIVKVSLL